MCLQQCCGDVCKSQQQQRVGDRVAALQEQCACWLSCATVPFRHCMRYGVGGLGDPRQEVGSTFCNALAALGFWGVRNWQMLSGKKGECMSGSRLLCECKWKSCRIESCLAAAVAVCVRLVLSLCVCCCSVWARTGRSVCCRPLAMRW